MKKLLKNKIFIGCSIGVLALAIIITVILIIPHDTEPTSYEDTSSDTSVIVEVPEPETTSPTPTETNDANVIPEESENLSDVTVELENSDNNDESVDNNNNSIVDNAPTVEESEPSQNEQNNVQIGGDDNTQNYSCGCENHHCVNAENHAYILNLELEGCPYCGSHSCPSFYATDEWGATCYTPSKCPEYKDTEDPTEYCQKCGRKNGNGDNDTCQRYIIDTICPICGELIKANECHTH